MGSNLLGIPNNITVTLDTTSAMYLALIGVGLIIFAKHI